MIPFDLRSGAIVLGLVFMALAAVVWSTLHRRADRVAVRLWCAGAMTGALALIGLASRAQEPTWLTYELPFLAMLAGPALRAMALKQHLGLALRPLRHAAVLAAVLALYTALHRNGQIEARLVFAGTAKALATAWLTWWAWRVATTTGSRSARLMMFAELVGTLGMAAGVFVQLLPGHAAEPPASTARNVLWVASLSIAALYGTLGYIGMVLDGLQAQAVADAQRAALASQRAVEAIAQREAAEGQARELAALLEAQARLTAEREQLLRVMAHEIRQPLHNASGVLQSLKLLDGGAPVPPGDLARRAARADAVLGQVRDVLDNVLATAVLLNRREAPHLQAIDLGFLVEMALLDLPESQRPQVRLEGLENLGPVRLEPHLLRLSLRNLLRNAFAHAGQDVQVVVSARRRREDGRLRVTVADNGTRLDAGKLGELQQIASSDAPPDLVPQAGTGRGLGLKIVRQVMALHGGRMDIAARPDGGLVVGLEFPPAAA